MRLQHRLGLQVKRALSEQPPRHANCLGQAVQVLGGRQERGCAASPRVAPRPTRYASEGGNPVYEDAEQAQLVLRGLQVERRLSSSGCGSQPTEDGCLYNGGIAELERMFSPCWYSAGAGILVMDYAYHLSI